MKLRTKQSHVIDLIFPIALFFVFAASSLAALVLSANVYSTQTADEHDNYISHTSLSYINEKIRQNDANGGISIETLDGHPCLVLQRTIGSTPYVTYIYEYDGMLKELFVHDGVEIRLKDGTDIMEIHEFSMDEVGDGFFRFTTIDRNGNEVTMLSSERSSS